MWIEQAMHSMIFRAIWHTTNRYQPCPPKFYCNTFSTFSCTPHRFVLTWMSFLDATFRSFLSYSPAGMIWKLVRLSCRYERSCVSSVCIIILCPGDFFSCYLGSDTPALLDAPCLFAEFAGECVYILAYFAECERHSHNNEYCWKKGRDVTCFLAPFSCNFSRLTCTFLHKSPEHPHFPANLLKWPCLCRH